MSREVTGIDQFLECVKKKYLKKVDRNSYNRKHKSVVSKQEEGTGLQSQVRQKGTAR